MRIFRGLLLVFAMLFFGNIDLLKASFEQIWQEQVATPNVQAFVDSVNLVARPNLHVCYGPMFAGKTTWLIGQVYNSIAFHGRNSFLAIRPRIDTRGAYGCFVSHEDLITGQKETFGPGVIFLEDNKQAYKDLKSYFLIDKKSVFLFDEAQFFFSVHILNGIKFLLENGATVYVAGLDFTSERTAFGIMKYLIPLALPENRIRLKARCTSCGQPAVYTVCLAQKEGDVLVGSDQYEPRCESCFCSSDLGDFVA